MVVDALFTMDIFIIFNSAYHDEDYVIVEDRKKIAGMYIHSWFFIDVLAVFPFELILNNGGSNNYEDIVRITRIGRMYKLVKMTRLVRILKLAKSRSKLLKQVNEFLKIGIGFERLMFFLIIFTILTHIVTCLLIMSAQFSSATDEDGKFTYVNTWMDDDQILGLSDIGLYITSFYYTISTITTVGYGDLHGYNTLERAFDILIMFIGVVSFSFATGSLSSILQNYDHANAKLEERIQILNRIFKDYHLPLELYEQLKQSLKYDYNKDRNDINHFVEELPHQLRLQVSLHIHEQTYKTIDIFRNRSAAFISWVCPLLKPSTYPDKEYIYFEGDDVTDIFFLMKGKAGFVLPKYQNIPYIEITLGSHFGVIDILGSIVQN